ncbi:MAG: amidohydrolase [Chitinophagaceae bacterium]
MKQINGFILALLAFSLQACQNKPNADTIYYNAHFFTMNSQQDSAKVMVVLDGKILAIGGDSLLQAYSAKESIDLKGQYVYPGFNDAHCHFSGYAMDKYKLALFGTKSFDEIIERIKTYSEKNNRLWIEGRGWDQNDWANKAFPNKNQLDSLFPDRPIYLVRIDGHAALCNQKALSLAGINENTLIEGGECVKQNGKLTGLLIDNAMEQVKKIIPMRTEEEILADLKSAEQDCFSFGLCSVTDCGVQAKVFSLLEKAYQNKALQIRNSILFASDSATRNQYLQAKLKATEYFHAIGFKLYADGALGSRGAFLLEEYHDRHGHFGLELLNRDSILSWANQVIKTDYQLCTHAIGDKANRNVLEIYAQVLKGKNDRRWRIEHAQVVKQSDRHYFGDFSIIPSVQPTHATSDMYWAEERLGPQRMPEAYAYQSLLKENNYIPLGTDFPVEEINPLATFCAAVFRQNKSAWPSEGFQKEEALTRHQALLGMTLWAAQAAREEQYKGSLEKGKVADFVVLPVNLYTANLNTIYNTYVVATYLNGKLVYSRKP